MWLCPGSPTGLSAPLECWVFWQTAIQHTTFNLLLEQIHEVAQSLLVQSWIKMFEWNMVHKRCCLNSWSWLPFKAQEVHTKLIEKASSVIRWCSPWMNSLNALAINWRRHHTIRRSTIFYLAAELHNMNNVHGHPELKPFDCSPEQSLLLIATVKFLIVSHLRKKPSVLHPLIGSRTIWGHIVIKIFYLNSSPSAWLEQKPRLSAFNSSSCTLILFATASCKPLNSTIHKESSTTITERR